MKSNLLSVFWIGFMIAAGPWMKAQEQTPPVATLEARPDSEGRDGSFEKPFNGSAIELFLNIQDETPTSYTWGAWQVSPSGAFCPGRYQFFSTENRRFYLKHPRLRSGRGTIVVIGFVHEGGFEPQEVRGSFSLEAHPDGCGDEGGGDTPQDLTLQVSPLSASFGQTITLSASAQSRYNSMTFLFYAGTSSQLTNRGTLIESRAASGCENGCSASTSYQAAEFPTTHFFMVEARDSSGTATSAKKAVQVSADGGGLPPDEPEGSPAVCQPCGGTVDAGPVSAVVVGGESLRLSGTLDPPDGLGGAVVAGTLRWLILDDAGLGSDLRFSSAVSANTSLRTPQVAEDTVVRIGFEGVFGASGCGCTDEMAVTILAEAPPAADLQLTKTAFASSKVGDTLVYTLTVRNEGPERANGVSLVDPLPQGLTYLSASPSQGSCQFNQGVLSCSLNALSRGSQATVHLETRVDEARTLVNNASVSAQEPDPQVGNNDSQAVTVAEAEAVDLVLSQSIVSEERRVGEELIYELTVANDSQTDASGVTLTAPIASQLRYLGASASQGSCSLQSPEAVMTCNLGSLSAGGQAVIRLRTRPEQAGEIVNTASVAADQEDSQPDDNLVSLMAVISKGMADLEVALASTPSNLQKDSPFSYVLRISNNGPYPADAVSLTSRFPDSFTSASALPSQGSCQESPLEVSCSLGSLGVGEEATVEIAGRASSVGEMVHTVEVESDNDDPAPDNNLSTLDTFVSAADFIMIPYSLGLANTFVGLGIVNLSDRVNAIEIQGLSSEGGEVDSVELPSTASRSQRALLTTEAVPQAETLVVRGREGPVRSFFMLGSNDLQELDGIGGIIEDSDLIHFPMVRKAPGKDTILFLFNPSAEQGCEVDLQLFDAAGNRLATATLEMAPMGSFRGGLEEIFGEVSVEEGYLTASGDGELRGFELVVDGSNFASLTGKPGIQTRRLLAPHFVAFPDATTVLRLLNLSESPAEGTVLLRNDSGSQLAEADFSIEGRQLGVFDLKDLFDFESLQVNTGYVEILLSGGTVGVFEQSAYVAANVTYQSDAFQATLPLTGSGHEQTIFLHVAQSSQLGLFHGLAVLNAGNSPAVGTVEVYDEGGALTGQAPLSLQPGERLVDLLNGPQLFGAGFSQIKGHIRVISDQPLIAFALFGGQNFLAAIEGQDLEPSGN